MQTIGIPKSKIEWQPLIIGRPNICPGRLTIFLHFCMLSSLVDRPMFNIFKFKKSDDQTNIDKYRVAANIIQNILISKSFSLKAIISKFVKIGNYFM